MVNLPTQGEEFSRLIHHLDEAQACAARISHLRGLQDENHSRAAARGWLIISDQLKAFRGRVVELARSKLQ